MNPSKFIFSLLLFQDSRLLSSDLAPPWPWEDAQGTLNLQPDGSALASLSAHKMPSAEEQEEEEEEGGLATEDEGFELLNSTYNKITGPSRPALRRSSGESLILLLFSILICGDLTVLHPRRSLRQSLTSSQGAWL